MTLQAKQTLQQRLMLAPNVTLALEVLRMPTMELRSFLERQLEDNPFLEVDESLEGETTPSSSEELSPEPENKPPELDDDWVAHWASMNEWEDPESDERGGKRRAMEQRLSSVQSIHESLRIQLGCVQALSDEDRRLGLALIDRLSDNGYLQESFEELANELGVAADVLERSLKVIQRLDPPGVGARDLRECLMIQAEQHVGATGLAYLVLRDQFELFVHHRVRQAARAFGVTPEVMSDTFAAIKRLDPRPGRGFACDLPPSVIPDVIVHHRERHFDVELNEQQIPRVGMSRSYYRMLKDARTPSDAKEFLAGKFQKASWLIKAIDERNTTLLAIARCLISLQREFLDQGPQAIKPLTQAQVAGLIGRHPSTVSRAIASKTIDTPYGVFRLEQLFASGVPQHAQATSISDEKIKSEIQRLITREDGAHPLSDAAITALLAQQHISVARRTIAKYRGELKILPAHLRRRRD